jgi:hypothetical protein
MQKKPLFIILITALATSCFASQNPPTSGPTAVIIVFDTAWSNEHEMSDYNSLSRQIITSLKPGDYIEIITGHPGKPRLRAAQFIKSGSTREVQSITSLLKNVNCPILSDVRISKSVDMALNRLAKSAEEKDFTAATVIVFTDGKLSNTDVARLQELSQQFKEKDWSLCVTGTHDSNKRLLVAANQGKFKFSLISEANPVLWIQSKRNVEIAKPAPSEGAIIEDRDSGKSGNRGYNVTIDSSVSISESVEKAGDTPSVELPDDLGQQAKQPQEPNTIIGQFKTAEAVAEKAEPNVPSEWPQEEAVAEPDESKKETRFNKKLLWLLPAIGLPAVLVLLFASSISKARKFKTGLTSRLKTTAPKNPGTLLAKINGQTHSLGRPDRMKVINIGSDSRNTIKTPGESISPRHVTIYHKGKDLMLKNVGGSPISVNGLQLKPKAKQKLVIPSVVKLNDKTKVNLTMLKPKPARTENGSDANGRK